MTLLERCGCGRLLALAALLLAACVKKRSEPPRVALEGECLLLYRNTSSVIGMDGASSVAIDSARSLFVFGDTFLGSWSASGTRLINGALDNTAAVVEHARLAECFDGGAFRGNENPTRVLQPPRPATKEHRTWPGQARILDGALHVTFSHVKVDPSAGFGFRVAGQGIARGRLAELQADASTASLLPSTEPGFSALLIYDKQAYVYRCAPGSTVGRGFYPCVLGRVALAQLATPSAYRYFVADRGFVGSLREASIVVEGAADFSVRYNPHLRAFAMIYIEPFGKEIVLRTAALPQGPFGEKKTLWACRLPAHAPGVYCYGGKEHEQLGSADGRTIVFSYNTNVGDLDVLRRVAAVYFPRLVRLDLRALGF